LVGSSGTVVQGTMLLIHGGGWQGPGPIAQKGLMELPGELLIARGWRVISLDYRAGLDGLQDVVDAAQAEIASPAEGPVCLYGESAGAHLALVAAARLSTIDCVVAAGAPLDLVAYVAEARISRDVNRGRVADAIEALFGIIPESSARFDPVVFAPTISADLLLLRQDDDGLIPREQIDRFLAVRPTTQHVDLASATDGVAGTAWLHGTLSDAGRAAYAGAVASFADRAVAADRTEGLAIASGCHGPANPLRATTGARLIEAIGCLARAHGAVPAGADRGAQTTTRRLHGKVNAARLWVALRTSARGRHAVAALALRHATIELRPGDPTRVIVRIRRRAT
jgi:hypothetical protein